MKICFENYLLKQNDKSLLSNINDDEVGVLLIASAKIPEREGSISLSTFYGYLPSYWSQC